MSKLVVTAVCESQADARVAQAIVHTVLGERVAGFEPAGDGAPRRPAVRIAGIARPLVGFVR